MALKPKKKHECTPSLTEAFLNGLVQILEARGTHGLHVNKVPKKKTGVKPSDAEVSKLITPEWIQARRTEISKLVEPYEGVPQKVAKGIIGAFIGKVNNIEVYAVDSDFVQINYDMDFVIAGNHRKWEWIPEGQFWVDKGFEIKDIDHDILHECTEEHIMAELGYEYDDAHVYANKMEKVYIKDLMKADKAARKLSDKVKK